MASENEIALALASPDGSGMLPVGLGGREIYRSAGFGGRSSGDSGRYQRELEDRRAQINNYEGVDPNLLRVINEQADANNLDPNALLQRYSSVYNAGQTDPANFVRQIYGDQDRLNQYAFDTFVATVGREPTANELASTLPYFQGVNGRQTGAAYLADFAQQEARSPEALARKAGQYSGDVNRLFDTNLGRGASQDELDYYGRLLATQQITPYEVEQLLKNTNEYRTAEDTKFRGGLADELQGYDQKFFDKAQEGVISRAKRAGGGVSTSSALDFALTNLMGDIADKRSQYLAGLSAQQYGGNKDAARQDYLGTQQRYLNERDYERNLNQRNQDYFRNRSDSNLDYLTQKTDYENYLNSQRQGGGNNYGALAGGGIGAIIGGIKSGPMGAQAGYGVGSGLGGAFDQFSQKRY